jgi:3-deoxy-D-manno-octulosonate 8-phosphate phosphatase (KDO 8-P phosphatase)
VEIEIEKLKSIKMLVLDVDGVLTDCRVWMDSNGQWKRIYSVRDGVGIKRLIDAGYKVAVITGSESEDVRARVKMLGMHYFYEGALDKEPSFAKLLVESGLQASQIAYVGDDIYDIPLIQASGIGVTVPEAVDEVLDAADYVTRRPGGNGAVREICDYILKYGAFSEKDFR